MGVFSSSAPAPQKEEPQCAPVEPAEKAAPEAGEGRDWHRGVLGSGAGRRGSDSSECLSSMWVKVLSASWRPACLISLHFIGT